jgi:hypothetical protein
VTVETAAPLLSPAYDQGATEDELRERWLRHYAGECSTVA